MPDKKNDQNQETYGGYPRPTPKEKVIIESMLVVIRGTLGQVKLFINTDETEVQLCVNSLHHALKKEENKFIELLDYISKK